MEQAGLPLFRVAEPSDTDRILLLYRRAARVMNAAGLFNWHDGYPDEATAREDMARGELFVLEGPDGALWGSVVANARFDRLYYDAIPWRLDLPAATFHRLCSAPERRRAGIGRLLVRQSEALLYRAGYRSMRIDCFGDNRGAQALYLSEGYREVARRPMYRGDLYLYLEKALEPTVPDLPLAR